MNETARCPICGTLFFPKRSDAIYCGARCRKRAQRKGVNRADSTQSYYRQALAIIQQMQSLDQQRKLRVLATFIIESLEDDERLKLYEAIQDDIYRLSVTHSSQLER